MMQIKFKIKERSWIARLAAIKLKAGSVAIVIGKTIHLHNASAMELMQNKRWLCHELKHVEQFRQHGFVPFIVKYLWESTLHGYRANKYEQEARDAENDQQLLAKMEYIHNANG